LSHHDITEILLKVALNTIALTCFCYLQYSISFKLMTDKNARGKEYTSTLFSGLKRDVLKSLLKLMQSEMFLIIRI